MESGKVYKVTLQPLTTSNYFPAGHRIRVEISSSNFPRFDRNMNTGGKNYDEATGLVAHNSIHHSAQFASKIVLSVVKRQTGTTASVTSPASTPLSTLAR
jgi:predicted acyl esterase